MSEDVISVFKPVPSGPNTSIWTATPGLQTLTDGLYLGRVFVEVWSEDTLVVTCGSPALGKNALAALKGRHVRVPDSAVPWTDQPATGVLAGQTFLGRVVIELWNNHAVVGVTGTSPQLLARTIQHLATLPS